MEPGVIGLLAIVLFFILMAVGTPIALALILSSLAGLFCAEGWEITISAMGSVFTTAMTNYAMTVIPAFVLMGTIAYRSGILDEIFEMMVKWVGRLPGGLAIGTVAANAILAACTGSIIAACTLLGRTAIPKMLEAGYPPSRAAGVVSASGTLASLIPPSILICIYGILVSQSIGLLLVAGIVPGIVSAIFYMTYISASSRGIAKSAIVYTWKEKLSAIKYLWIVGVVLVFVMGSIYFGVATPTEAGALGAFAIFCLAVAMRKMRLSSLLDSVVDTVRITGTVFVLILAASFFARLLVVTDLGELIINSLLNLDVSKYAIFAFVGFTWFLLGMMIDAAGMLVVSVPLVYPVIMKLGFDPIWFGIIAIKFCEMALITPPVGMAVFATASVAPQISLMTAYKGALRFLTMDITTVILLTAFPQVVLWLPSRMF